MNKSLGRLPTGLPQVPPTPGCSEELQIFKQNLPIWPHRDEIVRTIASNQVCIIEGQTGSGKTTQVNISFLAYFLKSQWEPVYGLSSLV